MYKRQEYGKNLDRNIKDLVQRLKNKFFKPLPSLRVYIPKANGKKRPLGIASYEDKIVQMAVKKILGAISVSYTHLDVYKRQFLSFPLTPLLAEKRLRRRNGKERKRQHRAQLIYTGKSSRTISTTKMCIRDSGDTVHGLDRRTQAQMQARIRHKARSTGMGAEVSTAECRRSGHEL